MDIKTAIYRYCNYQERSHQEVKDKLYELGAHSSEVNMLIAELIEAGLLNEERFAKALVRGKFNQKKWGRVKTTQALKRHRISEYLQKKALSEIDYDEYYATAVLLAERKWQNLCTEKNLLVRRCKVFRYLQQKGYESSVVSEIVKTISAIE